MHREITEHKRIEWTEKLQRTDGTEITSRAKMIKGTNSTERTERTGGRERTYTF